MFLIQTLYPDGRWVDKGVVRLEYWAYQDTRRRCCTEGRSHQICTDNDPHIVVIDTTGSCSIDRQCLQASLS